jgi:hypothetical protein
MCGVTIARKAARSQVTGDGVSELQSAPCAGTGRRYPARQAALVAVDVEAAQLRPRQRNVRAEEEREQQQRVADDHHAREGVVTG